MLADNQLAWVYACCLMQTSPREDTLTAWQHHQEDQIKLGFYSNSTRQILYSQSVPPWPMALQLTHESLWPLVWLAGLGGGGARYTVGEGCPPPLFIPGLEMVCFQVPACPTTRCTDSIYGSWCSTGGV